MKNKLPVLLLCLAAAQGVTAASLDDRVKRLEQIFNSGTLMELLDKVEQLQADVRAMRGELEEQRHRVEQLQGRQRDLYLDVDTRVQALENASAPAPAIAAPAPGAAPLDPGRAPDTGAQLPAAAGPAGAGTPAGSAGLDTDKEQKEYQQAFNLLKEARFDKAEQAFKAFLQDYPDGRYADNARYWLGETFYVTRQYQPALAEFTRMVAENPTSPKLSHAMLKMGYIQHELGEIDLATATLTEVQEKFPKTSAARLARERLARIKREGQSKP